MVAVKSHQADTFVKSPAADLYAYLVYGNDEGRISETALALARNWSQRFGEGGEIVTLDERALADNPDLVAIEIRSMPMFGGRSVVRLRSPGKIKPQAIDELIELRPQNLLILEAGNLTPSSPLRKLFEKSKHAAAIACFPDDVRDITRLIDEELGGAGIDVTPAARKLLTASLGTDRGVSRMELSKLALYAFELPQIDVDDVIACVGDSSQLAYDQLIGHILDGDNRAALSKLDRLLTSGQTCAGLMTVLGRYLARLYRLRAQVDSGRDPSDVVAKLRPPVHFKQRDAMIRHCRNLDIARLNKAIRMTQETQQQNRLHGELELARTERLIIILARLASRR